MNQVVMNGCGERERARCFALMRVMPQCSFYSASNNLCVTLLECKSSPMNSRTHPRTHDDAETVAVTSSDEMRVLLCCPLPLPENE